MELAKPLEATVSITIPYQDADPAGVVWHGNYFRYFDAARCALLDKLDYGYRVMEESGFVWPVVDTRVKFVKPARYGQVIAVTASLLEWEYRVKIAYRVCDESGECLTKGHTIQVAVNIGNGEMHLGAPEVLETRLRSRGYIE
jgi:acyl-CoA thioester hydrolase